MGTLARFVVGMALTLAVALSVWTALELRRALRVHDRSWQ